MLPPLMYAVLAHHAQRLRLVRLKDWADARYLQASRRRRGRG